MNTSDLTITQLPINGAGVPRGPFRGVGTRLLLPPVMTFSPPGRLPFGLSQSAYLPRGSSSCQGKTPSTVIRRVDSSERLHIVRQQPTLSKRRNDRVDAGYLREIVDVELEPWIVLPDGLPVTIPNQ